MDGYRRNHRWGITGDKCLSHAALYNSLSQFRKWHVHVAATMVGMRVDAALAILPNIN